MARALQFGYNTSYFLKKVYRVIVCSFTSILFLFVLNINTVVGI